MLTLLGSPDDDDLSAIERLVAAMRADRRRITALEVDQVELAARVGAAEGRHDWFTALGYARLHKHPTNRSYLARVGKRATEIMRERGQVPHRRQDESFGTVNVYPADVLKQAVEEI